MQNIDSASMDYNENSVPKQKSPSDSLPINQLNKVDVLKNEHICKLIQDNFNLNMDYIVAVTVNNEGEFIVYDGCAWVRNSLSHQLPENLTKSIKKIHYYYINKFDTDKLNYLCSDSELNSHELNRYFLYLFANDSSLSIEQRTEYQLDLGNYYYNQKTEPHHLEKAFRWFQQAAYSRNAYACFNVGYFYETGRGGIDQNIETALDWFRLASETSDDLIILLYAAQRLEQSKKDVNHVFSLYLKCAATGHPLGLLSLIDYHERLGREQDREIAQKLKAMLPLEYQSCQVGETLRELYQQEVENHRKTPSLFL